MLAGEEQVGGGVHLVSQPVGIIVNLHPAAYVEPRGYVVFQGGVQHIPGLPVLPELPVLYPVRVLEPGCDASVRPVLDIVALGLVPSLIKPDIVEILASRHEVESRERVEIQSLRHEVPVILENVVASEVEHEPVPEEGSGIPRGEVVAVVSAVRQDVGGIGCGSRGVGLVLLVSCGE